VKDRPEADQGWQILPLPLPGARTIHHAAGNASHGGRCHLPTCDPFRAVEQVEEWLLHRPLWRKHQDRIRRNALREQITHPLNASSCFAGPKRTGDEEF